MTFLAFENPLKDWRLLKNSILCWFYAQISFVCHEKVWGKVRYVWKEKVTELKWKMQKLLISKHLLILQERRKKKKEYADILKYFRPHQKIDFCMDFCNFFWLSLYFETFVGDGIIFSWWPFFTPQDLEKKKIRTPWATKKWFLILLANENDCARFFFFTEAISTLPWFEKMLSKEAYL